MELSLAPFGAEALETFLRIERPAPPGAPVQGEAHRTIGQFYGAVEEGLRHLCSRIGERQVFRGGPGCQVTAVHVRHANGRLIAVQGLASAQAALQKIVNGRIQDGDHDVFHPGQNEVAHYYRFQELRVGRRYRRGDTAKSGPTGEPVHVDFTGVHPMRPNPRLADHGPTSPIRLAQEDFNRTYCTVLHLLEQAFNGSPEMFMVATRTMDVLKAQARALMRVPDEAGTTAGPTFDYVPPEHRRWSFGVQRHDVVLLNGLSLGCERLSPRVPATAETS